MEKEVDAVRARVKAFGTGSAHVVVPAAWKNSEVIIVRVSKKASK